MKRSASLRLPLGLYGDGHVDFSVNNEHDLTVEVTQSYAMNQTIAHLTPGNAVELLHWLNDHVEPDGRIR